MVIFQSNVSSEWMVNPCESHRIFGWWFGTFSIFPWLLGIITPIDVHIFQRGGPTTNQICICCWLNHGQTTMKSAFWSWKRLHTAAAVHASPKVKRETSPCSSQIPKSPWALGNWCWDRNGMILSDYLFLYMYISMSISINVYIYVYK